MPSHAPRFYSRLLVFLAICLLACSIVAVQPSTPLKRVDIKASRLVELLAQIPPNNRSDRWELANIALDVLLTSYSDALSESFQERPRTSARQAKLYRWQQAIQVLIVDIESARANLLIDSDFSIYADTQEQVIMTVANQPLLITGLGRDDDLTLHDAIVDRFCAFSHCDDQLSPEQNDAETEPLPRGYWQIIQARRPAFIVEGHLQCRFNNLSERQAKATACGDMARELAEMKQAIGEAHGQNVPLHWQVIAASDRTDSERTALVLNQAGDYLIMHAPRIARLSPEAWQDLVAHLEEHLLKDEQTPHEIAGEQLLGREATQ